MRVVGTSSHTEKGLAGRRGRRSLRRLWDWRDVEGAVPYGSVGGILKLVLVNYSLHGLRSPHPSARLHLIEFCNFRGSHPPSPQWEGSVWRKFACSLLHIYSPTNQNLRAGGKTLPDLVDLRKNNGLAGICGTSKAPPPTEFDVGVRVVEGVDPYGDCVCGQSRTPVSTVCGELRVVGDADPYGDCGIYGACV